jgi:uncharacterized protein YndB with AHSA1/START domain
VFNIEKNVHIAAPIGRAWTALTDADAMSNWMEDDTVQIDLRVGGHYSVFGGETTGTFTQIEQPDILEYTWRQSGWPKSWPDSIVRWELHRDGQTTQVRLVHSKLPNAEERSSHDEGWNIYWLEPMTEWLETDV